MLHRCFAITGRIQLLVRAATRPPSTFICRNETKISTQLDLTSKSKACAWTFSSSVWVYRGAPLWEATHESRRCSRESLTQSHIPPNTQRIRRSSANRRGFGLSKVESRALKCGGFAPAADEAPPRLSSAGKRSTLTANI